MNNVLQDIRIARVSTIPFFVFTQLRTQLEALNEAGADVSIISSDESSEDLQKIKGCKFQPLSITREIQLFADFVTLIKLWKLFRKEQFHIVHSTTPKAGLLCSIAAKLAGVPVCIHTYTGQPWVTMTGIKKLIVKYSDKLISWLNPYSYTDSFSQRDFLIKNKIVSLKKLKVIGSGSLAGVNIERFDAQKFSEFNRKELKNTLKINDSCRVLLFVGRVTKEKGIFELIDSIHNLLQMGHDVVLLVVGPFEKNNEETIRAYSNRLCSDKIIFIGYDTMPERFMAISDLLCLPSYREGFGTVVIEAAAMGLPTVGTEIYGLTDSIVNNSTGMLVEPGNTKHLTETLDNLLNDNKKIKKLGLQAKNRAIAEFDSKKCHKLLIDEYIGLLEYREVRLPAQ